MGRVFWKLVVPVLFIAMILIEGVSAGLKMLNEPSDVLVFTGVFVIGATLFVSMWMTKKVVSWFPVNSKKEQSK